MIEPKIIARAKYLLELQPFVPESPAAYDEDGKVCLCSAGLLAMAGLESLDAEGARIFAERAAATRDDKTLYLAFDRLGWSAELCREMQQQNDFAPPGDRKAVIGERLSRLQRPCRRRSYFSGRRQAFQPEL